VSCKDNNNGTIVPINFKLFLNRQYGRQKSTTANIGLAKLAVRCSVNTFPDFISGNVVVNQTLVLRINPAEMRDGKNRHLSNGAGR